MLVKTQAVSSPVGYVCAFIICSMKKMQYWNEILSGKLTGLPEGHHFEWHCRIPKTVPREAYLVSSGKS